MYLLDRLYELPRENGTITIGGVDIRNMDLSYLRKNIGIVLQEPFLFSKSFKESIADGAARTDLETVRHFARLAVIDDAIVNFAQGYDTPIGEAGRDHFRRAEAAGGHRPDADAGHPHQGV